jgi:hypothetical protein
VCLISLTSTGLLQYCLGQFCVYRVPLMSRSELELIDYPEAAVRRSAIDGLDLLARTVE